ncbi:3-oxoacyl-[acyl-carrier-protein] reductase [uncultured Clostridium sp.]|jgi:3-oxoacyl-[acyl-carrier protein] reductase|uniref:3-oxoacyl-[acyl-carrier-protein] reductase n=1 Tax=uncultured Clostridium sp. TaxID=59620 RepID=UPI00262BDF46|nr:3-oxoacyl-[acyl-carrier-protein] reductase [uncultured Clostridium sp.]
MLKNKNIIITGATRGIGKAIALNLAKKGANIVIGYRNSDNEALKVKTELELLNVKVLLVKGDVSTPEYAKEIITQCKKEFGSVDILVNNAGITKDGLVMRMTEEDFSSVIDVNLKGTFNCSKEAAIVMLRQKSGKIINISSVIGLIGNAGQVNYAASKAGILGITKSLAKELGSRGITVNAVAPGFIQTDMTSELSDANKDFIKNNLPLKKIGKAEDVASVVSFLASDDANYITGQVINVDGGMVM